MRVYLYMDVAYGQDGDYVAYSRPDYPVEPGFTRYKIGLDIADTRQPHTEVEAASVESVGGK